MKLSNRTIGVLQNFATINQSLLFKEGNTLRTVSPQKTIFGSVHVDEVFEKEFGIYDLTQFLSALSLIKDADVTFGDAKLVMKNDEGSSISYHYADKSMIVSPPDKTLQLPDVDAKFTLAESVLKNVLQAARVLDVPEILVLSEDENIVIKAGDSKNSSVNTFKKVVGETDKEFSHVFKVDNLKMLMVEYVVEISSKGIAKFATEDGRITYFIATESKK
jgi:hypothetical protein